MSGTEDNSNTDGIYNFYTVVCQIENHEFTQIFDPYYIAYVTGRTVADAVVQTKIDIEDKEELKSPVKVNIIAVFEGHRYPLLWWWDDKAKEII